MVGRAALGPPYNRLGGGPKIAQTALILFTSQFLSLYSEAHSARNASSGVLCAPPKPFNSLPLLDN